MNAPLYTIEILRLAGSLPDPQVLERVDGSARERSPTCGSVVATKVQLAGGLVEALSQQVSACAFGQASAALVAQHAIGRTGDEVETAMADLSKWLAGTSDAPGDWPDVSTLSPARSRKSRHGAILLPFRALLGAIGAAK